MVSTANLHPYSALRDERNKRRADGIPTSLLSSVGGAADGGAVSYGVPFSVGRAPASAPYGGIVEPEMMAGLEEALQKTLKRCGAAAPNDKWLPAANVKVMMARGTPGNVVVAARTR